MSRQARRYRKNVEEFKSPESIPQTRKQVEISFLTQSQKDFYNLIENNSITIGMGKAGTGKTTIASSYALKNFVNGNFKKIIICRPAVEAGNEKHGFLPGSLFEKLEVWVKPVFDVFETYWSKKTIMDRINDGSIELASLCHMRGRSLKHTMVIIDETQNADISLLFMLLTRLGEGSKMVLCGDPQQSDIKMNSLQILERRLKDVNDIAFFHFGTKDVVRHPTVAAILDAWDNSIKNEHTIKQDNIIVDNIGTLPKFITN